MAVHFGQWFSEERWKGHNSRNIKISLSEQKQKMFMQARVAGTYCKASIKLPPWVTARSKRRNKNKYPSSKFLSLIRQTRGIKNQRPFFVIWVIWLYVFVFQNICILSLCKKDSFTISSVNLLNCLLIYKLSRQ